jgi:hypothetical protein
MTIQCQKQGSSFGPKGTSTGVILNTEGSKQLYVNIFLLIFQPFMEKKS